LVIGLLCGPEIKLTFWLLGVLGATGSVGQRFILLLALHPHFTLHAVGASERSAGKKYKDAVKWKQSLPMSKQLGELVVRKCTPDQFADCDMVFSGLDSDVAGDVEMAFLKSELAVWMSSTTKESTLV
jgi:aspartate-semialdehyde dehydrogenase